MNTENILIVCSRSSIDLKQFKNYYKIGVEKGCLDLIDAGLPIDYAVGDFDSVTSAEYKKIKDYSKELVKFPSVKDLIDGEIAVLYAKELKPENIVLIADGPRIDMAMASLELVAKYDITLLNDHNQCQLLPQGKNKLKVPEKYNNYVSFISLKDATIQLKDFKYEAKDLKLTPLSTNAISNEFLKDTIGTITVDSDQVIVLYS